MRIQTMDTQGVAEKYNQDKDAKTMLQQALLTTVLEDLYALIVEDEENVCGSSEKGVNPVG